MDMVQIGKKIAVLRKNNGFTQETLADKLGISPQAVSKWETGMGLPEASLLVSLSELFRTQVDDILRPGKNRNTVAEFMARNLAAPAAKVLEDVPRVSRWHPPAGCDMYYSMPAMIAEALCCIEAYERGESRAVSYDKMNDRFRDLLHITGVGYGFLWHDGRHMIEELWQINKFKDMTDRAMRYYGRNYLWLTGENTSPDELRWAVIWSVHNGRPVAAAGIANMPEFNIITGYEDSGNTIIGYTHCEECAVKTNALGMFVNPARWDEKREDLAVLLIGDKTEPTYGDQETMLFALEVLDKKTPEDGNFGGYEVGDAGIKKWWDACGTDEDTIKLFTITDIFTHALYQNSIYTQKCILSYFKKLGERKSKKVHDTVNQITIAVDKIARERSGLDHLKDKPAEYAAACRTHIENLIKHREYMRGWLREIMHNL